MRGSARRCEPRSPSLRHHAGRILQAGDQARQRLERRLHDGAERRLAEVQGTLHRGRLGATGRQTADQIARGEDQLARAREELRQLALGLHPRALSERGLAGALARLADGSPVPVELSVASSGLAPQVEAAAYFICSEGLANVAKYAAASRAAISVTPGAGTIVIVVSDDGPGGADPGKGSGLTGLADRVRRAGRQLPRGERAGPRHAAGRRDSARRPGALMPGSGYPIFVQGCVVKTKLSSGCTGGTAVRRRLPWPSTE